MEMTNKILVVDDDEDIVRLIRVRLISNNFNVVTASDGHQALEKVREHYPQIIILDVHMPGLDGYSFVRELKNDSFKEYHPTIIILTGKDTVGDIFDFKGNKNLEKIKDRKLKDLFSFEGIKDYISKPFTGPDLLEKVRNYAKMPNVVTNVKKEEKEVERCVSEFEPKVYRNYSRGFMNKHKCRTKIEDEDSIFTLDDGLELEVNPVNDNCTNNHKITATLVIKVLRNKADTKSEIKKIEVVLDKTEEGIYSASILKGFDQESFSKKIIFMPQSLAKLTIKMSCSKEGEVISSKYWTYTFKVAESSAAVKLQKMIFER